MRVFSNMSKVSSKIEEMNEWSLRKGGGGGCGVRVRWFSGRFG